jgi:hypothetical protein
MVTNKEKYAFIKSAAAGMASRYLLGNPEEKEQWNSDSYEAMPYAMGAGEELGPKRYKELTDPESRNRELQRLSTGAVPTANQGMIRYSDRVAFEAEKGRPLADDYGKDGGPTSTGFSLPVKQVLSNTGNATSTGGSSFKGFQEGLTPYGHNDDGQLVKHVWDNDRQQLARNLYNKGLTSTDQAIGPDGIPTFNVAKLPEMNQYAQDWASWSNMGGGDGMFTHNTNPRTGESYNLGGLQRLGNTITGLGMGTFAGLGGGAKQLYDGAAGGLGQGFLGGGPTVAIDRHNDYQFTTPGSSAVRGGLNVGLGLAEGVGLGKALKFGGRRIPGIRNLLSPTNAANGSRAGNIATGAVLADQYVTPLVGGLVSENPNAVQPGVNRLMRGLNVLNDDGVNNGGSQQIHNPNAMSFSGGYDDGQVNLSDEIGAPLPTEAPQSPVLDGQQLVGNEAFPASTLPGYSVTDSALNQNRGWMNDPNTPGGFQMQSLPSNLYYGASPNNEANFNSAKGALVNNQRAQSYIRDNYFNKNEDGTFSSKFDRSGLAEENPMFGEWYDAYASGSHEGFKPESMANSKWTDFDGGLDPSTGKHFQYDLSDPSYSEVSSPGAFMTRDEITQFNTDNPNNNFRVNRIGNVVSPTANENNPAVPTSAGDIVRFNDPAVRENNYMWKTWNDQNNNFGFPSHRQVFNPNSNSFINDADRPTVNVEDPLKRSLKDKLDNL